MSDLLAWKPAFGSVVAGRDGCVQVAIGDTVLRLGKADYWTLMELLSDAARRLVGADPLPGNGAVTLNPNTKARA